MLPGCPGCPCAPAGPIIVSPYAKEYIKIDSKIYLLAKWHLDRPAVWLQ